MQLPSVMKFTEDQIGQLLSSFWIQSTLSDISPSNVEAIAHSFSLVLLSLRLKVSIKFSIFFILIEEKSILEPLMIILKCRIQMTGLLFEPSSFSSH